MLGGCGGLFYEVADDGVLEAGDEVEGLLVEQVEGFGGFYIWVGSQGAAAGLDGRLHGVGLGVAEDSGFDAAEGEVERHWGRVRFC